LCPAKAPAPKRLTTRLEQQARQALAHRDAAAAAGGGNALFVPVAELTEQIGNFEETTARATR
jgi:enamine deaminase RidA (YjgF/YER057c/UK114 family)